MTALDRFPGALVQHRMEALRLESGRPPLWLRSGNEYDASKEPLPAGAVESLLGEISGGRRLPADGSPWEFDYAVGDRRFAVRAEGGRTGLVASLVPRPGDSAPVRRPPSASATGPTAPPTVAEAHSGRPLPAIPELLALAVRRGASDIHLSSGQPVRLRVDGDLEVIDDWRAPTAEELERLVLSAVPEANREEFRATHDTDFGFELAGQARFRANLFQERQGVGAAFRLIPNRIPTIEELGLPEAVQNLTALSKGLVLVTGPTGSGKSTTLAALVDLVNRTRRDHIITIEDPIEFVHLSKGCLIHQRQVGVHTQSFARALRAALREDPDVVMVGEMRDLETTSIALQTAETGHLVFGTLHTTSAPGTIERLIDQFPADQQSQIRLMFADGMRAIISQQLLKKIGGGRVAAFEVLLGNPAIANMIREGKTFQIASAMQTGRRQGMTLLNDSPFRLVDQKLVAPSDAYVKAADKEDLLHRFRGAGIDVSRLLSGATTPPSA